VLECMQYVRAVKLRCRIVHNVETHNKDFWKSGFKI